MSARPFPRPVRVALSDGFPVLVFLVSGSVVLRLPGSLPYVVTARPALSRATT
ncbi:hypothetical protein [Nocardioides taihuensis]|uniref:Uncharacterized protein n=1 Tax=Nocardioides taihuensis TaxID=1835606 RepID=A0ABW0BD53_9ACTN